MEHTHNITKESFSDFWIATKAVVLDAWRDHREVFVILSTLSVLTAFVPYLVSGINAVLINHLVDVVGTGVFTTLLIVLLVLSAVAFIFQGWIFAFMRHRLKLTWFNLIKIHDQKMTRKLATLDVATHEDPKFQDKLNIVQERGAIFVVANFLESFVTNFQNVLGFLVATGIVIVADWRLFVLILIFSIPRLYAELRYGEGIWSIWQDQSEDRREYQEVRRHTQSATGIRELQVFQIIPHFLEKQRALLGKFYDAQEKEEKQRMLLLLGSQILVAIAVGISLFVLVSEVVRGEMQIGTFTFVFGAVTGLESAMAGFFLAFSTQHRESRYVKAYFDILGQKSRVISPTSGTKLKLERAPEIEFRNVSFAYPTKPEDLVLKNFSLTIGSGERVALVGVNGAGKSTLIKLLCRFYDPMAGEILVNGTDLRELDLDDWYRNLALLSQDYATYRFKAWELIQLGRLNGTRDQRKIKNAARRAHANAFIERWEDRYDQQIGVEFSGGINPSDGQRQKLALARTLYRNAFVTILDEPTALVDAEAEAQIFEHLEQELRHDQSLILISHRFSTVRTADLICVIKDGEVHELGTHEELLSLNGTYADLFEKQAVGYR